MSTSVKISKDAKRLLDALQAKLLLSGSRKMSQQEILDAIVNFSSEREEELMRQLTCVHIRLSPQEIDDLMKIPTDWGVETREEEIDNILYAGDSKF